jgi:hypothetical protein
MKKNRILTESQKKQIIENKQKNIIENFSNVFNKIKRLNENEIGNELPEEDIIEMLRLAQEQKHTHTKYRGYDYTERKYTDYIPEFEWDPTKISDDDEYSDYKYEFVASMEYEEKGIEYIIIAYVDIDVHTSGEYRAATLEDPPEYPESEIEDIIIKNIKVYKEFSDGQPEKIYTTNNKQLIDLIKRDVENIVETLFDNDEL